MGIACALYDQLEIVSSRNQKVRLIFEANKPCYEGKIKTLKTKAGQEYAVTAEDEWWLLEGLLAVEVIKPTD